MWLSLVKILWGFISKYPAEVFIVILLAALGVMKLENHHLLSQNAAFKTANEQFAAANVTLNKQIADQNSAILVLQKKGQDYDANITQAQHQAQTLQDANANLLAAMKKKATPKTCDGAMGRLLDDAISRQKH